MRGRQLVYLHEDQRNFKGIETTYFFPLSDLQRKIFVAQKSRKPIKFVISSYQFY